MYTDPDPIGKVVQGDYGQVNIEVKSSHSIGEETKKVHKQTEKEPAKRKIDAHRGSMKQIVQY